MRKLLAILFLGTLFLSAFAQEKSPQIKLSCGTLAGTVEASGIRSFKGIPFAQPPVGDLRWKEPQTVKKWNGVRKADHFGPRAMQKPIFSDMVFRSDGVSEDCLYLNVWTPAKSAKAKLPVLLYFYGGGFVGGDGSENRYDGENIAEKGIVSVTISYRLGIFGFLAHPELTKESPHHASGNYGLLDQNAALLWVKNNIAAFGGDPDKITIGGESAGSISVFAQMASPLSRKLIAGAIGESGAMINPTFTPITLAEGEKRGVAFAEKIGTKSLAELRAIPAEKLLDEASKPDGFKVATTIDGYFFPEKPEQIFAEGKQAQVPLLVGWNSAEVPYQALMGAAVPTPKNYQQKITQLYGDKSAELLKLYPGKDEQEVIKSATALASDRFIVYSTWKWAELQTKINEKPVYRYIFSHARPPAFDAKMNVKSNPPALVGASHASEIEYALGNLGTNKVYDWTKDDYKVSATMLDYFANFIKKGNPNGKNLIQWPANKGGYPAKYMDIDASSKVADDENKARYQFLEKIYTDEKSHQ